jgi:hypothetical protein
MRITYVLVLCVIIHATDCYNGKKRKKDKIGQTVDFSKYITFFNIEALKVNLTEIFN